MSRYAENTQVSPEKSRAEIEAILRRYGANGFMNAQDDENHRAMLGFKVQGRAVKFILPMPDPNDKKYFRDGRNHSRTPSQRQDAYEQDVIANVKALSGALKTIQGAFGKSKDDDRKLFPAETMNILSAIGPGAKSPGQAAMAATPPAGAAPPQPAA